MKSNSDRIKSLSEAFAAVLESERRAHEEAVSLLVEAVRELLGETADRRLQRLVPQLRKLQERLDLLAEMASRDYIEKIAAEAEALKQDLADGRIATLLSVIAGAPPSSLNHCCEFILDRLIEVTGAERGFILFYIPESTEADVIAARNFQTTNLSLEEYDFSRSVLGDLLERAQSVLLEDASKDSRYSRETSINKFQLKSVLAVPLAREKRTIGALYLEDNTHPLAFDEDDRRLLEAAAQFLVFYLHHARLLPAVLERDERVFLDTGHASREIVGRDPKILKVLEIVARIASSPAAVLIEGESGTGKELVARALHYQSARSKGPFVAINCAAIPDNLLESELFGHERGAFTGATERYIGRIEQGNGGTIFLDEVSELAYPLQAKLLRFLQSNEFHRLGGKDTVKVDVRIVAATSKDLRVLAREGRFQEALFYRLNVIPLPLPSLRERKEDIPLLIEHLLRKFSAVYGTELVVDAEVYDRLKQYPFPGNVRELENLIHRLVALASTKEIRAGDLPAEVLQVTSQRVDLQKDLGHRILDTIPEDLQDLQRRRSEVNRLLARQELQLAERTIKEAGGNLTEAAARLGVHRVTLHKILRRNKESD